MKLPLIAICSTLLLVGCNTQSKKVESLIKHSFEESAELYEGYTPIENTITEEYNRYEYDIEISDMLDSVMVAKKIIDFNEQEVYNNSQKMQSFISSGQTAELKRLQEWQDKLLLKTYSLCKYWKKKADIIKFRCKNVDTTSVVGWRVKHTFCYKTSEGVFDTAVNYYVIDKNYKTILHVEQEGNEDDMQRKMILDDIANNDIPPLCTAYNLFYALVNVSFEDYGSLESIIMLKDSNPNVKMEFGKITERMGVAD